MQRNGTCVLCIFSLIYHKGARKNGIALCIGYLSNIQKVLLSFIAFRINIIQPYIPMNRK